MCKNILEIKILLLSENNNVTQTSNVALMWFVKDEFRLFFLVDMFEFKYPHQVNTIFFILYVNELMSKYFTSDTL
jgi:hypothetical protein